MNRELTPYMRRWLAQADQRPLRGRLLTPPAERAAPTIIGPDEEVTDAHPGEPEPTAED